MVNGMPSAPQPSQLRQIERREWFLVCSALLVIFLLTWAVLTFSYRSFHSSADPFYIFQLQQAVRALVGLVLLFAIYTFRLQLKLQRMRRCMAAEKPEGVQETASST